MWYRYSDRAIRNEDHWYTALAYIHENPVKHGYVKSASDWGASSVHWYTAAWGEEPLRRIDRSYPRRGMGTGWDD
jgi:putative transposase